MDSKKKTYDYKDGDLTVLWTPEVCIHSKKCFKGLPDVFKPKEKPWIQTDGADNNKLVEQIKKCPSGALQYRLKNENADSMNSKVKIQIIQNGPLMIEGECEVINADGSSESKKKAALCRCGSSKNKPYCDGTHNKIEFKG